MFRKSRKDQVVEQASHTSAQVKDQIMDKVVPAVGHAAESTRDWAAPRVTAARDWAAPRAQKGLDAAAPKVEHAVEAVTPKIDAARDKLVDEVLPRLVDAINAATSQAAAAKNEALDVASDVWAVGKGDAVAVPKTKIKRKHRIRKVLMLGGVVAAGAAAFKALRTPKDDPWATPAGGASSWAPTPSSSSAGSSGSGGSGGTEGSAGSAAEVAADAALEAAAESEATESGSAGAEANGSGEGADLGSGEGQEDAPDGDQPGKITASRAARKAKPRDDG